MANLPEFTLYFKMGIVGMAEEATETFDITVDPALTAEENQELLLAKAKIFQLRMQLAWAEVMTINFPKFMEAKAEAEGWDLDGLDDFFK